MTKFTIYAPAGPGRFLGMTAVSCLQTNEMGGNTYWEVVVVLVMPDANIINVIVTQPDVTTWVNATSAGRGHSIR